MLHQMQTKMQAIVTDVPLCQSVCHTDLLSFGVKERLNELRSSLGLKVLGAQKHCARLGPDTPWRGD